jgi:surface protein
MSVRTANRSGLWNKGLYDVNISNPFKRNIYWPIIPTPAGEEILALYAVYPGFPTFIALKCSVSSGLYRVALGDGTSADVASATQFNATIDYADTDLYSDPNLPYKIASVRVTPVTVGATFSAIDLSSRPTALALTTNPNANWLEVKMAFSGSSSLIIADSIAASCRAPILENVEVYGGTWNTNYSSNFLSSGNAINIRRARLTFNNATNFSLNAAFYKCTTITDVEISVFGTGKPNSCSDMFYNCFSIAEAPFFDTSAVTTTDFMFQNCYSLTSIPSYNLASATNLTSMFQACGSLISSPTMNTPVASNLTNMFRYCFSLVSVSLFNTPAATTMTGMFNQCYSLPGIPLLDTSNVTNMNNTFWDCQALITIPLLNTSKVTNMNGAFDNCLSLISLPALTTTAVTIWINAFRACRSLNEVPAISLAGGSSSANLGTILSGDMVSHILAFGARFTHTIASQNLGATALNEYYTNLPTVSSQTLTVSTNYGTATDNPAIATAKGWTLTGSLLVFEPQTPADPKDPPLPPILIGPRNGFYKWQSEENILIRAGEFVHGPGFDLYAVDHETYQLPIDGWYWFDDEPQARTFLNVPIDALFQE